MALARPAGEVVDVVVVGDGVGQRAMQAARRTRLLRRQLARLGAAERHPAERVRDRGEGAEQDELVDILAGHVATPRALGVEIDRPLPRAVDEGEPALVHAGLGAWLPL